MAASDDRSASQKTLSTHSFDVVASSPTVRSAMCCRRCLMPIKQSKAKATRIAGIKELGFDRFHVVVTWNDRKTGRRIKREAIVSTLEDALAKKRELRDETHAKPIRERF